MSFISKHGGGDLFSFDKESAGVAKFCLSFFNAATNLYFVLTGETIHSQPTHVN